MSQSRNTEDMDMNNNETRQIEKIRAAYTEREESKFDQLKNLNKKVSRPAKIFAYIFGTIAALILGTGMCLAMKVIGDMMLLGIVIGCVGLLLAGFNYRLYEAILASRKKKYAPEILALSDELLGQ